MPGLLVISLGAVLALADDVAAEAAALRAAELREEIRALETLRRVAPDAEQAEWMLHAARWLEKERSSFEARRAALLAEQQEAFRRFLVEDRADRGFTPAVERAAAEASVKEKELHEEWEVHVARMASAVREILRPDQEATAEGRRERRNIDANRPPCTVEDVQGLLLRVRMLPEIDYRRREGQIAGFALRSPGIRAGADREAVIAALVRFRAAREEDLPRLRGEIVADLFPGVRAAELVKQNGELKSPADEAPGRLGDLLGNRVAVPALEALLERLRRGRKEPEAGDGSASDPRPSAPKDDRKDRRPAEEKPK